MEDDRMRLRWWLLIGMVFVAMTAVAVGPVSAYPARSCGKFGSMTLYSHLKKGGDHRCPLARRLMAQYIRTKRSPSGYSCSKLSWSVPAYCRRNSDTTKTFYLKR
jgi:hypothetical protein